MKFSGDYAMKYQSVFSLGMIVLTLLLSGCIRDSRPVQFYMLNADYGVDDIVKAYVASQGPVIGLGPIRIPEYLNRPQMIVAIADNQYRLSEDHRWAEPLDQNISLALFKALPLQLGTCLLYTSPSPRDGLLSRMPSSA